MRTDQGILIEGERIVKVGPYQTLAATAGDAGVVDLGGMTVLPSGSSRTIPTCCCRATSPPPTTPTSCSGNRSPTAPSAQPDVDLRNAINRGIIPESRLFVATRAFAPTGRSSRPLPTRPIGWDGIDAARRAGFNRVEHGDGLIPDLIERMVRQKVYWCPTIFVGAYVAEGRGGIWPRMVELEKAAFGEAVRRGLLPYISYGTDAGGYDREPGPGTRLHGEVRHDLDAGDSLGDQHCGPVAGEAG